MWSFSFGEARQTKAGIENALPETINVIAYAEFDNVIEVDKAHNVRLLGMNSQQLVSILKQDHTVPLFCGMYPINHLPPI